MKGHKVLLSKGNDEWKTPQWFVRLINKHFKIDIDPCCSVWNVRAKKHFTKKDNGLKKSWDGNVYMNPPYIFIKLWMRKALEEYNKRKIKKYQILCLVPSRTGAGWFQQYAFKADYILFISKRLKFYLKKRKRDAAPFDCCLVIYGILNRYQVPALQKIGVLIKLK